MIKKIGNYIKDKDILILGFGKEGQSTYHFIRKIYPNYQITIADIDESNIAAQNIKNSDQNSIVILGTDYMSELNRFDIIIKSPGIYLAKPQKNITSQTALFLKYFHNQTIGVTGTKGKSTTSSLIHHILQTNGKKSLLVGNIGQPPFDIIEEITDDTIIVFELSSHQLADVKISPHTAILLNLFPEHLDHYPDFETYVSAKTKIFNFLNPADDIQIYNSDQAILHKYLNTAIPKKQTFGFSTKRVTDCFLEDNQIFIRRDKNCIPIVHTKEIKNLIGKHNMQNVMAAIVVCLQQKIAIDKIRTAILTFKSLEHRLEYAGYFSGIHFYNDSIATIPEATMMAVKSIPETDTLILGGYDRGLNYNELYKFLNHSNVRNFILMGPAGIRINKEFQIKKDKKSIVVNSLKEAFKYIPEITRKDKVCLLSPAAASYDQYKNFEERGHEFKIIAGSL